VKLYSYWRSSSSWRVRIALGIKGMAHETIPINIAPGSEEHKSAAYAAIHPAMQVPVLVLKDTTGGHEHNIALSQSVAILELLEELYPDPPLLPKGPVLRAKVREVVEVINSGIQPFQNTPIMRSVEQWTSPAQAKHWIASQIAGGLHRVQLLIEPQAQSHSFGGYCFGDSPTLADVFLIPQLYGARRYGADLTGLDTLLAVERNCEMLPAFQRAHPDAQPDAPKG